MADRLISADALKAALQGLYQVAGWEKRDIHFSLSDMECNIDYMPTIEAVPLEDYRSMEQTVYKLTQALAEAEPKQKLVRCKECKHYEDEEPSMVYCPNIVGGWVSNIFYCGYGERKDEVEE